MPEEFRVEHPITERPVVTVAIEDSVPEDRKELIRASAFDLANIVLEASGVETQEGLSGHTLDITSARAPNRPENDPMKGRRFY